LKKQLAKCGIDVPVYGVRGKTALTLGEGWKSYETFIKELFNDLTVKHGMEKNWDYLTASIEPVVRELATEKFDGFSFPPCIQDVVDTIKYVHNLRWNDEMYLAQHLFDGRNGSYESNLQPKIEKVFETYPMLRFVGWLFKRTEIDKVKDYINLVG
jgi:hypothetical protein